MAEGRSGSARNANDPFACSRAASARTPSSVLTIRYVLATLAAVGAYSFDDRAKPELVEDLEAPLARGAAIAERVGVECRPAR